MEKREHLESLQSEILEDSDLFEHDGKTFCNCGSARLMRSYDYDPGDPPPLANDMIQAMIEDTERWSMVGGARAVAHAMRGGLAFAVKKYAVHGHLASIAPREMEMSGSLGHTVPMVANCGKGQSRICKVSEAFPVAEGEPRYLILDAEKFA